MWLLFLIVFTLLFLEYNRRRHVLSLREKLGLHGPPANILTGNLDTFTTFIKKNGLENTPKILPELERKYGQTYGFYNGTALEMVTTEPAHIRDLFITQFSSFVARKWLAINRVYPVVDGLLQVDQKGTHAQGWKEIRTVVSAIFTSGKMKMMHRMFHGHTNNLMECLREKFRQNEGSVEIYGEYQAMTMDMIGRCALGMEDISCLRDRDNPFYTRARTFIANFNFNRSLILKLSLFLPFLCIFRRFTNFGSPERKIVDDLSEVIGKRREERTRGISRATPDLIDLILIENEKRVENGDRPLHHDVIVSNCYAFFIAGYETTSTALSYATWLLAAHPECQERLHEEIEETFGEDDDIDYDRVMKIPYLNAVFSESLRLYPPVTSFTARRCVRETSLGQWRIPEGVNVVVPVTCVHRNENNWPDPDAFIPERFLGDKPPSNTYTYMPFGIGPRNCVGARFAEMEFKTVLASVVRRFRFEIDPTEPDLKTFITSILQLPLNNRLFVRVIERDAIQA